MEEPKPTIASGKTAQDSTKVGDKKNPSVEKDIGLAGQQAGVNNPITRKLNKILESRVENDKVKKSTKLQN